MSKFEVNDRVKVISNCQSYHQTGVFLGYTYSPTWSKTSYGRVRLDNGDIKQYNTKSLEKINDEEGEINNMGKEVQGNYTVAMVKFNQGFDTKKHYAFALFEEDVFGGCQVLCDTTNGYGVATVVELMSKDEYLSQGNSLPTKEIICRVNFDNYNNRITMRQNKAMLKAKMDKMLKENQEIILYQAIAEKNPEMAALLEEYKTIGNV